MLIVLHSWVWVRARWQEEGRINPAALRHHSAESASLGDRLVSPLLNLQVYSLWLGFSHRKSLILNMLPGLIRYRFFFTQQGVRMAAALHDGPVGKYQP